MAQEIFPGRFTADIGRETMTVFLIGSSNPGAKNNRPLPNENRTESTPKKIG